MLKQTFVIPILLLAWLLTFIGHVQAQENYPMMLMVKLNNDGKPADKLEIMKINTKLNSVPSPRPLIVHGYHRKTDAYAVFIKDYRLGQFFEDVHAVYPNVKHQLKQVYPNASFSEVNYFTTIEELE
jgi:hypothetical protein